MTTVSDGIATIEIVDTQGLWNARTFQALESEVARLLADAALRGVILIAGRANGSSGLDADWLDGVSDPDLGEGGRRDLFHAIERMQALLARIEAARVPFVAAVVGPVAGPELEICLACHARVGAESSAVGSTVGSTSTPAVTLTFDLARCGLPPMLGAAQRLARRWGTQAAEVLLYEGKSRTASQARELGLLDDLVDPAAVLARAHALIADNASADNIIKARAPSPAPSAPPSVAQAPEPFEDTRRPAAAAIRASLADALAQPMATALRNDGERFVAAAFGPVSRAMVRTQYLSVARANRLASRPAGFETRHFRRVGVLGAGLMGAGIACVCARAGMDVVLIDTTREAAERGKAAVARQDAAAAVRIRPSDCYDDLADVDIVVEAVFEDRAVKASATKRAEACLPPLALFATNTSTLPISGLAQASVRAHQFIGLHFFSPVPRMPLLEVIRGRATSDATLAAALDFARAIGKTPIVVNDSRGFYTTRVIMTYQAEAFEMIAEGVDPELIERAGLASGMPLPPLLLSDAVAIDLIHQINQQTRIDEGATAPPTAAQRVVAAMVEDHVRPGKKAGRGFYDYTDSGGKRLWPELSRWFAPAQRRTPSLAELKERLLDIQSLEAFRCLDGRVIVDPSEGDVGALLGWNFAPWTGGPLSRIDQSGPVAFVARCDKWAARLGARFQVPQSLRALAADGATVYARRWN